VRPRIVRVDACHELPVEPLDPLVVSLVFVCPERPRLGPLDTLEEVVRRVARDGDVTGLECEPEPLDQAEIGGVERAHDLAAELDGVAVVDPHLLDAPAYPMTCLQHGHVRAAGGEVARCRQTGQAGP
jgi:hypothetical protein